MSSSQHADRISGNSNPWAAYDRGISRPGNLSGPGNTGHDSVDPEVLARRAEQVSGRRWLDFIERRLGVTLCVEARRLAEFPWQAEVEELA